MTRVRSIIFVAAFFITGIAVGMFSSTMMVRHRVTSAVRASVSVAPFARVRQDALAERRLLFIVTSLTAGMRLSPQSRAAVDAVVRTNTPLMRRAATDYRNEIRQVLSKAASEITACLPEDERERFAGRYQHYIGGGNAD